MTQPRGDNFLGYAGSWISRSENLPSKPSGESQSDLQLSLQAVEKAVFGPFHAPRASHIYRARRRGTIVANQVAGEEGGP
jgi:hypothetical protein